MQKIETNQYHATPYKLRRTEAQLLATYARNELKMNLPNGWNAFYRLTPHEINKKYPQLEISTIIKEARIEVNK